MASHGANIDPTVTRIMIDEGIKALTGESAVGDAWLTIFPNLTSDQVIGIKINTASSQLPTHPNVVLPLIDSLTQMTFSGNPFPENNIIIWDRNNSELTNAGYTINTGSQRARCFGTNPSVGYASTQHSVNGVNNRFSQILEGLCDHILNVSVLKNHGVAGVTLCMKNHYGTASNVAWMHGNACDPYIPALNAVIRDECDGKDRLKILDAIFGAHYGGPGGPPTFVQNEILMSVDPVAIDTLGCGILSDHGCQTINLAHHVATAAEAPWNLGNHDLGDINIIQIEEPSSQVFERPRNVLPESAVLYPNYPNPFNPSTTIPFALAAPSRVKLEVFSATGQRVTELFAGQMGAGQYEMIWNGKNHRGYPMASGIYFCRLSGPKILETRAMTLLR
jgi:uncharacterized protein (DUF362 family)